MNKDNKGKILGRKEKNTLSIILSVIILISISVVAYAYFTASITNNSTNRVTITTKTMTLTFADGETGNINAKLGLGETTEKKFTITNTGDLDAYAKLMWKNLENTYIYRDLKYTLSYSTTENGTYTNLTYNENIPASEEPGDYMLKGGIYIPVNTTYYFKLIIQFMNWKEWDQTADMDATFRTKFDLVSDYESPSTKTLLALGLGVQNKISNYGDYDHIATTDETANGLFSIEDDYGTSYYFRGAVENNYVKFGKYSDTAYYGYKTAGDTNDFMVYKDQASCTAGIQVAGATAYNVNCTAATALAGKPMYWRIIRINGDGSLRMIYDGTQAYANGTYNVDRFALRNKTWNLTYRNDAKYVGYMYGGANGAVSKFYQANMTHTYDGNITSLSDDERLQNKYYNDPYNSVYNQTPSNMKTILESWFEQNLLDYDIYLSDEIFCNDRTISIDGRKWRNDDAMKGWGADNTILGTVLRLRKTNDNNDDSFSMFISPSLKCDQKNDSFTKSDTIKGNGKLLQKVGLATADEYSIAGARSYIVVNNSIDWGNSLARNAVCYLCKGMNISLSPNVASSWPTITVYDSNFIYQAVVNDNRMSVLPVINLSAENARTLIGAGTSSSPYELSES